MFVCISKNLLYAICDTLVIPLHVAMFKTKNVVVFKFLRISYILILKCHKSKLQAPVELNPAYPLSKLRAAYYIWPLFQKQKQIPILHLKMIKRLYMCIWKIEGISLRVGRKRWVWDTDSEQTLTLQKRNRTRA